MRETGRLQEPEPVLCSLHTNIATLKYDYIGDNGKENGNYYNGLCRGYIGV